MEKVTGSELVKRVLKDPNGSIEKLLKLSGCTVTNWLEVKSATLPEYVVKFGADCGTTGVLGRPSDLLSPSSDATKHR